MRFTRDNHLKTHMRLHTRERPYHCHRQFVQVANLRRHVRKAGRWDKKLYDGYELYGKSLGIVGLGRIGKKVALSMQSLGTKTISFDPIVSAEEERSFNIESTEFEKTWALAIVFCACKKRLRIVNVARGAIIHEKDLLVALKNGRCGGAASDVFEQEPSKDQLL
ncbi:hypothetical protein WA026_019273 [Henosepilachna vigintioctopunctata]|uniref:C2H2-type domain-containing protein n=1 Tax=Henosepilachna vigintioctopunctata TaxID=420089 RepID=A0AAW1U950_9CUCU